MSKRHRRERIPNSAQHRQRTPAQVAWQEFLAPLPPQLRAMAARVQQCRPPCLLCQQPYHALGVFTPHDMRRWGVPKGFLGGCVYALCQACMALPDKAARVEAVLWRTRSQVAAPWN